MKYWNAILVVLAFIMGSTLTLFFVSVDDGKINSAISFSKFGHSTNYENISNRHFLLIVIISNPDNVYKRNTIRETWLQFVKEDKSVKHLFVIGTQGLPREKELLLTKEYKENADILSLNTVIDSYNTLARKLLTSFVFIEKEFNSKFVLKCDDDSFVRISDILSELKTKFLDKEYLYWGFFDGRAHVKKVGKWKETDWFLCDRYLPYALGGGYVLSFNLVKYISKNAEYFSLYKSEDVALGVWLSPLNISRIHDTRFDTEFVSRGCSNTYLITHKHSEKVMRHLYSEIVTHNRLCSQEKQIRPSYIYNWKVLPSQCCIRNDSSLH